MQRTRRRGQRRRRRLARSGWADSLLIEESTVAGNRFSADTSAGGVVADGRGDGRQLDHQRQRRRLRRRASRSAARSTISFSTIADNGAPARRRDSPPAASAREFGTTVALNGVILSGNQAGLNGIELRRGRRRDRGPRPQPRERGHLRADPRAGSLVDTSRRPGAARSQRGADADAGALPGQPGAGRGPGGVRAATDQRGVARPGASRGLRPRRIRGDGAASAAAGRRRPRSRPAVSGSRCATTIGGSGCLKKCGKKRKRAKNGRCVKRKRKPKKKRARARAARGRGRRARRHRPLGPGPDDRRHPRRRPRRRAGRPRGRA